MIRAFPYPTGWVEGGGWGRTMVKAWRKDAKEEAAQREVRRAACGLLKASKVELELANTKVTPGSIRDDARPTDQPARRNSFT